MEPVFHLFWQKAQETLFITEEQFLASLDGWESEAIYDSNGDLLGGIMRKGPELHFVTTGKSIPRRIMRQVLEPIFDEYGYVTTRTPKHEERQLRFNRAWGFVVIGEDALDFHLRLDRRTACPSRQ